MSIDTSFNSSLQTSLESTSAVIAQQEKDWFEVLPVPDMCQTFFDCLKKNQYVVKNPAGQTLLSIEDNSYRFKTILSKNAPPFWLHASTANEKLMLEYHIPTRLFQREVYVADKQDMPIGKVRQRFASLRNTFLVYDAAERELYRVVGKGLLRWGYAIYQNGVKIGMISTALSGLGHDRLTDADPYFITFPHGIDLKHKYLLLGVLLLMT